VPVSAADREQRIAPAGGLGQPKLDQAPGSQIVLDHPARHIAPAQRLAQQFVLGAQVPKPPGARADHREFLAG